MAIKERLLKQLNIVRDGLNAMPPFHSRDLNAMRNALVQARDLCFQGLPSDRVSDYQDVYDGLLLAVNQLAEGAEDGQEIASLCQDLLQYLSVQTQKETSFKKEIVFLPYQASMWDSLESVWKAANEDKEHCNAYVIPIPYCDRNPDMTAAQWHCERGMFPKYVPTLDWREVNLEEWHPDVIFIHNAYDDRNAVTSVDSRYYSKNLKKCTDKLVYIPYAVEEEVQPGNEAIEEAISHRVLQPGVLNADLVIAQSEDTRQAWINILVRHTNVKDRAYWESRILGLGSPKIDKVLTSNREDFDMPEKWRKLIEGKKVILYNTSLGAMLQNSDKVCDKLRYVFDIFRNRDDVVLWWRPHPLMKSTIHSMRPQFEEEYCQIEKDFIEEGWGIYDDSPDLHRAICWSDAYYGDPSSVVTMYRVTGKPVMMQAYDILPISTQMIHLGTCASVLDNGNIWFSNAFFNSLFCFRLRERCIDWIGRFKKNDCISRHPSHYSAHVYKDELIFTPFMGHDICIYNKRLERFSYIPIPCEEKTIFCKSVMKGESIFIPSDDGHIWEYNLNEHTIKDENSLSLGYRSYIEEMGEGISSMPDPNGFTILRWKSKKICRVDLDSRSVDVIPLDECADYFLWATYDGRKYWLCADESHDIISWEKSNKYTRYQVEANWGKEKFKMLPYHKYAFINNEIYVSNCNSSKILRILPDKKEVQVIGQYPITYDIVDKTMWGTIYSDVLADERKVYFVPYFGSSLISYDIDSKQVESWEFSIESDRIPGGQERLDELLQANVFHEQESTGIILEEFVLWVKNHSTVKGLGHEERKCGAKIFLESLKGEQSR